MSSQSDIDQQVAIILNNIIGIYKDIELKDIFAILVKLMECAEQIPSFVGADKKKVVKSVLTQIIERINFPKKAEKDLIIMLINCGIIDIAIDSIIKLTKEGCKINLQAVLKESCCGKCKCNIM
jgi:hypothetical protein